MNCERFKEMILDSVVDGYDPEKNNDLQTHILTCADCRLEYEQIKSAVRILKPEPGERLAPVEKLKIENRIYEARLRRFASKNTRGVYIKRLTAIAAALFFFFLGFSIRSIYTGDTGLEEKIAAVQRIEELPAGRFLLMAKGRKALLASESPRQFP
jgi:hypothetical protein